MAKGRAINEELLVSRLVNGDMDAFDEIYWKYQRAVYLNALRLTREADSAEDIVQEVFISLWEKRDSIHPDAPLAGWLFVSSYNRAVNVLRKKLRESVALDILVKQEQGNSDLTEISESQLAVLNKAMSQLSPQKRLAFELCKLQGKTYEEAAAEMKISKHTVKEYLTEAVQSVKNYVKDHPILVMAISAGWFFNA